MTNDRRRSSSAFTTRPPSARARRPEHRTARAILIASSPELRALIRRTRGATLAQLLLEHVAGADHHPAKPPAGA